MIRKVSVQFLFFICLFFFFQAEDGIRDRNVTGVQTCALPISFSFRKLNALLMKSPSRALAVSRENAYEATKFTFVMPRTGLAFCDVSFTCSALYADRPIGKSIWFAPTLALIPGKAAPVSGVRPVA